MGKWVGIAILSAIVALPAYLFGLFMFALAFPDSPTLSPVFIFAYYCLTIVAFLGVFGLVFRTTKGGTAN